MKMVVCRWKKYVRNASKAPLFNKSSSVKWHEHKGKSEFSSGCRDICKEDQPGQLSRVTSTLPTNASCLPHPQPFWEPQTPVLGEGGYTQG